MLPSPQTSEDVLAPSPFERGGAEFPTVYASAIWRKRQRHRAGVVSMHAAWIARVGQCSVVCYSVFASLAPPSSLLPMTASCMREKAHTFVSRSL
jgi:hypothetical protein